MGRGSALRTVDNVRQGNDADQVVDAVEGIVRNALGDVLNGIEDDVSRKVAGVFGALVEGGSSISEIIGGEKADVLRLLLQSLSGRVSPQKDVDVLGVVAKKYKALKGAYDGLVVKMDGLIARNLALEELLEAAKKVGDAEKSLASDPTNSQLKDKAAVAKAVFQRIAGSVGDEVGSVGGGAQVVSDLIPNLRSNDEEVPEELRIRIDLLREDLVQLKRRLEGRDQEVIGLQMDLAQSLVKNDELIAQLNESRRDAQEARSLLSQALDRADSARRANADVMRLREGLIGQVAALHKSLEDALEVVEKGSAEGVLFSTFTFETIKATFDVCTNLYLKLQPNIVAARVDFYGEVQALYTIISKEMASDRKIPTLALIREASKLHGMLLALFSFQEQMVREHVNAQAAEGSDGEGEVPDEWVYINSETNEVMLFDFYQLLGCGFGDTQKLLMEGYGAIADKNDRVEYAKNLFLDSDVRARYDDVYFRYIFMDLVKAEVGNCFIDGGGIKNYYEILEVPQSASNKEIKDAYRKLSRKYHPDSNLGDGNAERMFQELNEANMALSDCRKRDLYDRCFNYLNN